MGFNIGAKGVAVGLYAITGGDVEKAKDIWYILRDADPAGVYEALELVDNAVKFVEKVDGLEDEDG